MMRMHLKGDEREEHKAKLFKVYTLNENLTQTTLSLVFLGFQSSLLFAFLSTHKTSRIL